MICPECFTQMHQDGNKGGGLSRKYYYETWEIKVCPNCGRRVKEFYSVEVLNKKGEALW